MTLTLCAVTGEIDRADGTDFPDVTVRARLSGPDWDSDGSQVIPREVTTQADAAGAWSLSVWPSARGTQSTTWTFEVVAGGVVLATYVGVSVPDETTVTLDAIINPA